MGGPARELLPKTTTPLEATIRKIVYRWRNGRKKEGWLVRIGRNLMGDIDPITEWHGIFPSEADATRWARTRKREGYEPVYCKRCLAEILEP